MKYAYFECQCHSDEHTLKFSYDPEIPEEDMDLFHVYTSVFLHQYRNIWQRLWVAIKYFFGYKCKYGHWDCFMLQDDDVDRLIAMLTKYKEIKRNR